MLSLARTPYATKRDEDGWAGDPLGGCVAIQGTLNVLWWDHSCLSLCFDRHFASQHHWAILSRRKPDGSCSPSKILSDGWFDEPASHTASMLASLSCLGASLH